MRSKKAAGNAAHRVTTNAESLSKLVTEKRSSDAFRFSIKAPHVNAVAESAAIGEFLTHDHAARVKERRQLAERIHELRSQCKSALVDRIGVAAYRNLLARMRVWREGGHGVQGLRHDPERRVMLVDARRREAAQAERILNAVGVRTSEIRKLRRDTSRRVSELMRPKARGAGTAEVVREDQLPPGVLAKKSNPWTIRTPPFDGWVKYTGWERWGGSDPSLINWASMASGAVGQRCEYENYDAGDDDGFYLESYNAVGVWFYVDQKPKNTLEIYVKARCDKFRYFVWLDDEFGWSDSYTVTNSYFDPMLCPAYDPLFGQHLLNPAQVIDSMWWKSIDASPDDKTYKGDFEAHDHVRWMHFTYKFQNSPYAGWYVFWIGPRDLVSSSLNDVSADIALRDRWFIDEVHLEVE